MISEECKIMAIICQDAVVLGLEALWAKEQYGLGTRYYEWQKKYRNSLRRKPHTYQG
jgi:hypothetical protein